MRDLAIIVPTRGRPGNVRKVIDAWDFTNAWDHADLVLAVDADDPEIQGYQDLVDEFWQATGEEASDTALSLVEIPVWMPMVHKLNAVARQVADKYRALGFAGDDHLPRTIGWAARYLKVLGELGTGMVYGDDGYQGAKLSTEWAVTSDVVRSLHRMVPADVEHMYCDNAMMDLFGGAGAMRHLPEIRIEHMHPVAGKAETDAQYQRVNHRDQFGKDRRAYEHWKRDILPSQIGTVRALRGDRPEVPRPKIQADRPVRRPAIRGVRMGYPRFFKQIRAATPENIMMALADMAAQVPADQEIVELGVFQGRSTLMMAWGARQGHGAHVTGIDPWSLEGNVYDPPFTDDGSRRWAMHWVQSLGYSRDINLIQDFSHRVAEVWNGKPVGLLYVDGDHTKEGAKRDVLSWARHLAPGATIAVDDYGHPDWPGVGEAVDELVAEGVLEPFDLFHDRLAVTRLKVAGGAPIKATAITSEGVSPSPDTAALEAEWERVDPEGVAALRASAAKLDSDASRRQFVQEGELEYVPPGEPVSALNLVNLKALAKVRGIVLGARKDKRDLILQALRDGR